MASSRLELHGLSSLNGQSKALATRLELEIINLRLWLRGLSRNCSASGFGSKAQAQNALFEAWGPRLELQMLLSKSDHEVVMLAQISH